MDDWSELLNSFESISVNRFAQDQAPQTGDLLLFGTNRGSGFAVRTGTTSIYTHVGIAVWLTKLDHQLVLESDKDTELYIYEMSRAPRYDPIVQRELAGAGLTSFISVRDYYSIISVRPLRFRPTQFLPRFQVILDRYHGTRFREEVSAFLGAWLQLDPFSKDQRAPKFICTELVNQVYQELFELEHPLGPEAPWRTSVITPEMFTPHRSSRSPVLASTGFDYYGIEASLSESVLGPLILAAIVVILLIILYWAIGLGQRGERVKHVDSIDVYVADAW